MILLVLIAIMGYYGGPDEEFPRIMQLLNVYKDLENVRYRP
jgi:hypothetical protein